MNLHRTTAVRSCDASAPLKPYTGQPVAVETPMLVVTNHPTAHAAAEATTQMAALVARPWTRNAAWAAPMSDPDTAPTITASPLVEI
jgi:hypothetical protein